MSIRHYIIIEKDNEVVYEEQILGNNDFFSKDFKFYPKEEYFEFVEKTEIDFKYLMVYWRKWLALENKESVKLMSEFKESDDLTILEDLLKDYYILEPFNFMKNLFSKGYLDAITLDLKENYKIYLEVI